MFTFWAVKEMTAIWKILFKILVWLSDLIFIWVSRHPKENLVKFTCLLSFTLFYFMKIELFISEDIGNEMSFQSGSFCFLTRFSANVDAVKFKLMPIYSQTLSSASQSYYFNDSPLKNDFGCVQRLFVWRLHGNNCPFSPFIKMFGTEIEVFA